MRSVNLFRTLIFTIIAFSFSILNAATYYWVGGTGNWSQFATHWAKSSGGAVFYTAIPTTADTVIFDDKSFSAPLQIVTVDVMAECKNFTCTGVTNNPMITGFNMLMVDGSIKLTTGMKFVLNSQIQFTSNNPGNIIDIKTDSTVINGLQFNGDGAWTFQSDYIMPMMGNIMIQKGTLNTNGKTITVGNIMAMAFGGNVNLIFGNSIINTNWINFMGPVQLDAGTSTLNLASNNLQGNNLTFYDVNILPTMPLSQAFIRGGNTFNVLSFNKNVSAVIIEENKTQTLYDLKIISSCGNRVLINSDGVNPASIKKFSGFVILDYLDIKNVTILGGATFTANNSINLGNAVNWVINPPAAQNFYWIKGTGNWSDPGHWAKTSGGLSDSTCIPTNLDNVFFDANSFTAGAQTVSIDVTASCNNMAWTGATNNPALNGFNTLFIGGSLTLINAMTMGYSGTIEFNGNGAGNTITSAARIYSCTINFNGSGDWTLQDNFNSTSQITYNNGTLNTGGRNITCSQFFISNLSKKSVLNLGASIIQTNNWNVVDTTGLKLNAGISLIRFNNGGTFNGGGIKYNNLIVNAGTYTLSINGSNTFNTVTLSTGNTLIIDDGTTQTVTNIVATGTCNNWITILSGMTGTQAGFSSASGTINISYIKMQDLSASGGATFNAANSIDQGNNSGWNITQVAARTLYWVGNGGNWNDFTNHWSIASGGAPGACLPTEVDSVIIDNSSLAAGNTLTINSTVNFKSLVWSNTNGATLAANNQTINCYGSLKLNSNVTLNFTNQNYVYMKTNENGHVINTANKIMYAHFTFDGSGSWQLLDSLRLRTVAWPYYNITFNKGTLTTNNYSIVCQQFSSTTNKVRKLNFGSSRIISLDTWNFSDSTNLTINAGTSKILSNTSVFSGGSETYNYVYLPYANNLRINGTNTFDSLMIPLSRNIIFERGSTQTFNTLSILPGLNCLNYALLSSSTSGDPATLKKTAGTFTGSWLNISDVKATGGATFTANNSTGSGNVTGWTFVPALTGKKMYWVGGSGDWSSPAHWSNSSGGPVSGCLPTAADSVYFDANSFTNEDTVNVTMNVSCKYMDWTGAKFNPYFTGFSTLSIAGGFKLISAMNYEFGGALKLTGSGTYTINTLGKQFNQIEFAGSGDYSLGDSLTVNTLMLTSGILRTNNQKVNNTGFGQISSNSTSPRSLFLGSSIINTYSWSFNDSTKLSINAGTSTINVMGGSFDGGFRSYNIVNIKSNPFGGSVQFYSSNTFNQLSIEPGTEMMIENGMVQTVTQLNMSGKAGLLVNLRSWTAGSQTEIKKLGGDYCGDYLALKDIKGSGASFYAGGNSLNNGGNTGWTFNSFEAVDQYPSVCESPVGSGSKSGINLTSLNNAVNGGSGNPVTWYNDAGFTSPVATPTNVTVTDGKTYYAKVTSGGCTASAIARYSVLALPVANDINPEVCEDSLGSGNMHGVDLTLLNDTVTGGATVILNWFNDFACTSPVATPSNVVVTTSKKFYAKVDNGTCTNIATVTYAVIAWPVANNHNPSICEDAPGSGSAAGIDLTGFNPVIIGGSPDSVAWYTDTTCATPVATPANITINDGDKFFAKVTNSNGCENIGRLLCTVSGSIATTDQVKNVCEVSIGSDTTHVDLTDIEPFIAGGIPAVFTWFSDTASTDTIKTPANLKVDQRDTFYVNVVSGICSGKAKATYIVNSLPVVDLGANKSIYNTDSVTLDAGAGFAEYAWSTLDTTQTIKVVGSTLMLGTHKYSVTVTTAAGCSSADSVNVEVKVKVGIEILELSMAIYPNPASDRLNILIDGATDRVYQLQLFSISGQLLFDRIIEAQESNMLQTLDVTMYPGGIYLMVIKSDKTVKTVKIILEK